MFKGPQGFPKIINACMNIIIGLVVGVVMLSIVQGLPGNEGVPILTPMGVLQSLALSFCIGYTGGDILPLMAWGQKLAGALHATGKWSSHIVISVVLGLGMAIVITFLVAFINNVLVSGMAGVIGFFVQFIPIIASIAVVTVILLLKPVMALAVKVSGFNPAEVQPQ